MHIGKNWFPRSRRAMRFCLALVLGLSALPAVAIDNTVDSILDIVIQELSPELAPAKPFVVCLLDHGADVEYCAKSLGTGYVGQAKGEAQEEVKKSLPFDPGSPEVKLVLDIVKAANEQKWDVVLSKGGPYLARTVICAVFVPPGVKSFGCPVIGYVIEHQAGSVKKVLAALQNGDVPGLVSILVAQFGPEVVCELIPSSALPAGASELKDIGCSVIGEILAGAKKIAEDVAGAVVKGADAVENLLFGDDSHMPYDKYYGLYWQPWYHYATSLCLGKNCEGLGSLNAAIGDPCVSYFDSHNQYKSTAEKTCGDMRKKFEKEVKAFSAAMKAAGEVYGGSANKMAKDWAVSDWGKGISVAWQKKEFAKLCEKAMEVKFPFPAPVPGRCELIKKSPIYKNPMFKDMLDKQYAKCQADAGKQVPSPTAWAQVCQAPADKFAIEYAAAQKAVNDAVKKIEALGCKKEQKTVSAAPKLVCTTYEGFGACQNAYSGKLPCSLDKNPADTAMADKILAQLGTKRCSIKDEVKILPCPKKDGTTGTCQSPEKNILCSRPWKVDLCKSLLQKMAGKNLVATTVKCKAEPVGMAAFVVLSKQAGDILFKLNGGVGSKSAPGTTQGVGGTWKPASSKNCKASWDPLSIHCSQPGLPAQHQISLPSCMPDPNKDGADAPCLLAPLQYDPSLAPVKEAIPGVLAPPPPLQPAVGMPPPIMQGAPAVPAPAMTAPPTMAPPPLLGPAAPTNTITPIAAPPPQVPGCTPLAGQPGHFSCATREAHAGCERLRASGKVGIRACQGGGGRLRP